MEISCINIFIATLGKKDSVHHILLISKTTSHFFICFNVFTMQEELEAQKLLHRGKKQRKRKWRTEEENEEVKSLWSWIGGRAIFLAIVSILLAFIIWLGYERL